MATVVEANVITALGQKLEAGAKKQGVVLTEQQIQMLLQYLELFIKWNKAYNLSAVRDPVEMVHRHLLDSLSVVPHILSVEKNAEAAGSERKIARMIDVGTGGGLPGIPLAILFPEKEFTLLDSNGKKTRFLFQVKIALGLENVTVENRRVESFQPAEKFDAVISRAFASLLDMTDGCTHLLKSEGLFWAMKGVYPEDELRVLAKHYKVVDSFALTVPYSEGERHLILLSQDRLD